MNNKFFSKLISILFLLVLCSSFVFAGDDYDLIVVNSNDWEDVYNSFLYGAISHTEVLLISDQTQSSSFFNAISRSTESVLLVESDSRLIPTAFKVLSTLDYDVEVLSQENTGLFFYSLLESPSIILVDKDFPLNGLSVAPYAVASESWVFFVDSNYDSSLVPLIKNTDVMSFGRVPLSLLQSSTPSLVIDNGNKYRNGVELAKLFLNEYPTTQFVLTAGTFLESEFFSGSFPVLVVGVSSTPKPIEDFFVETNIKSAVVVGQASIPPSMALKRLLDSAYDKELKLVAKLGQTSPDPNEVNSILPLNTFPIPSPSIDVSIDSFFYNQITRQLELRVSNVGDIFLSYVPSIVLLQNGETIVLESDKEEYFLEKSESRTIQFPIELDSFDSVSATATIVFGESSDSFEFSASKEFSKVDFISIVDDSDLILKKIVYDLDNNVFLISVFNNGTVPAYADIDLNDLIVGGDVNSFSSPRAILVAPGDTATLVIYALLSEIDVIANPVVSYDLAYGQRNFALIKLNSGTFSLDKKSSFFNLENNAGLLIALAALIIFGLLFFFLFKKGGSYVCEHCDTEHSSKPSRCKSCGFGRFKKRNK